MRQVTFLGGYQRSLKFKEENWEGKPLVTTVELIKLIVTFEDLISEKFVLISPTKKKTEMLLRPCKCEKRLMLNATGKRKKIASS